MNLDDIADIEALIEYTKLKKWEEQLKQNPDIEITCPSCSSKLVKIVQEMTEIPSNEKVIMFPIESYQCEMCGIDFITPQQEQRLDDEYLAIMEMLKE